MLRWEHSGNKTRRNTLLCGIARWSFTWIFPNYFTIKRISLPLHKPNDMVYILEDWFRVSYEFLLDLRGELVTGKDKYSSAELVNKIEVLTLHLCICLTQQSNYWTVKSRTEYITYRRKFVHCGSRQSLVKLAILFLLFSCRLLVALKIVKNFSRAPGLFIE